MSEARQLESQAFENNKQFISPLKSEAVFTSASNATWFDANKAGLAKAEKSLAPLTIDFGSNKSASGKDSAQPTESSAMAPNSRDSQRRPEESSAPGRSLNAALTAANSHMGNSALMGGGGPASEQQSLTGVPPHHGLSDALTAANSHMKHSALKGGAGHQGPELNQATGVPPHHGISSASDTAVRAVKESGQEKK